MARRRPGLLRSHQLFRGPTEHDGAQVRGEEELSERLRHPPGSRRRGIPGDSLPERLPPEPVRAGDEFHLLPGRRRYGIDVIAIDGDGMFCVNFDLIVRIRRMDVRASLLRAVK